MSAPDTLEGGERPTRAQDGAALVVTETVDAGVGVITLANPGARNALSLAMMSAVQEALDRYREQDDVRAIVLAAQGTVFLRWA